MLCYIWSVPPIPQFKQHSGILLREQEFSSYERCVKDEATDGYRLEQRSPALALVSLINAQLICSNKSLFISYVQTAYKYMSLYFQHTYNHISLTCVTVYRYQIIN